MAGEQATPRPERSKGAAEGRAAEGAEEAQYIRPADRTGAPPAGQIRLGPAALAAHADWSIDPKKRWVAVATPGEGGWLIDAPEPVGEPATFLARLQQRAGGGPVALGLDLPIGVPRDYAALRPEPDFLDAARSWPDFFRVCATLPEVRPDRPFYPARGVKGMTRAAHARALGLGA